MAYASDVQDATVPTGPAFTTRLGCSREHVNVQIRFFSDVDGLVPVEPGTGSATLTPTNLTPMTAGTRSAPVRLSDGAAISSGYVAASTVVAAAGGVWQNIPLGAGATSVTITPTLVTHPDAPTYRIVIDTEMLV